MRLFQRAIQFLITVLACCCFLVGDASAKSQKEELNKLNQEIKLALSVGRAHLKTWHVDLARSSFLTADQKASRLDRITQLIVKIHLIWCELQEGKFFEAQKNLTSITTEVDLLKGTPGLSDYDKDRLEQGVTRFVTVGQNAIRYRQPYIQLSINRGVTITRPRVIARGVVIWKSDATFPPNQPLAPPPIPVDTGSFVVYFKADSLSLQQWFTITEARTLPLTFDARDFTGNVADLMALVGRCDDLMNRISYRLLLISERLPETTKLPNGSGSKLPDPGGIVKADGDPLEQAKANEERLKANNAFIEYNPNPYGNNDDCLLFHYERLECLSHGMVALRARLNSETADLAAEKFRLDEWQDLMGRVMSSQDSNCKKPDKPAETQAKAERSGGPPPIVKGGNGGACALAGATQGRSAIGGSAISFAAVLWLLRRRHGRTKAAQRALPRSAPSASRTSS